MTSLLSKIERVPVESLNLHPRNARQVNVLIIAASLTENAQYAPLVVQLSTNYVLAGNHTLKAARSLDWPDIDVVYVDVDDERAAKIMLSANRTADLADYDDRLLLELLADLPDLDGTGYDAGDLAALEAALAAQEIPEAHNDPDDVPGLRKETVAQLGDVWQLGPHRLAVGDSTDVTVWDDLMDGDKADCMWTDPPYDVSYVGKTKDALRIENDDLTGDRLTSFLRGVLGIAATYCKPGGCWYVAATPGPPLASFTQVMTELDVWHQTLIWVKDSLVMGYGDYHPRFEVVFYGWVPGEAHHRLLDRTQDNVHEVPRPKASKEHPTMKPVALITKHIENSTDPGEIVADPFGGSGSTLIACHGTNRIARLIELDPKYADVILRRYQEHAGVKPTRDGVPHDFTAEH